MSNQDWKVIFIGNIKQIIGKGCGVATGSNNKCTGIRGYEPGNPFNLFIGIHGFACTGSHHQITRRNPIQMIRKINGMTSIVLFFGALSAYFIA